MKYSVCNEGVEALRNMAQQVSQASSHLDGDAKRLSSLTADYDNVLGPHKQSIDSALADISSSLNKSVEPANNIAGILTSVAEKYQNIIDVSKFGKGTGGTGISNSGSLSGGSGSSAGNGSGGTDSNASAGAATSESERSEMIKNHGAALSDSLSSDERSAIKSYTATSYVNINATLRGLDKGFEPGNLEKARSIHSVLSRSHLPCECTVYRGVSTKALGNLNGLSDEDLQGQVFHDRGFLSTSLDRNSAFASDMILVIHAPAGSNGMYVGHISSAGQYEQEVLFDVDQSMRINNASRDEYGRRVLDVTLI